MYKFNLSNCFLLIITRAGIDLNKSEIYQFKKIFLSMAPWAKQLN